MQAGYAGCFFEKRPARLRLGLDQLADAALPHHGGRAGAGRLVGEQKLHVLGACFLAVDAVDGARFPLDAAGNLQFISVVEKGRCGAVGIVEEQCHFRRIACGAGGRAGEDNVVHAGGAHVLVGTFAHYPSQGFDQVGLAATVRPDDAGQSAFDYELASLDE